MDLKPPSTIDLKGNLLNEWTKFKQKFLLYLEATEKSKKSGKIKVALLLCLMGDGCLDIFNTFKLDDKEKDDLDFVIKCFDEYFEPKANTVINRYTFFNLRQKSDETVQSFVTSLKNQAKKCQFGDQEESLVRDLLIIGTKDEACKERLLMESDLKLDKAVNYCKAREESQKQVQLMKASCDPNLQTTEVNKIKLTNSNNGTNRNYVCSKCLRNHSFRNCPAWGKKCTKCKKLNHFANACKAQNVNEVESNDVGNSLTSQDLNIETILINTVDSTNSWRQNIIVNGVNISFKLDTGADVNVIPYKLYQQLAPDTNITVSGKRLTSYSGHNIKVIGTCLLNCTLDSKTNFLAEFYIVNDS
jgi:hypothetical protein